MRGCRWETADSLRGFLCHRLVRNRRAVDASLAGRAREGWRGDGRGGQSSGEDNERTAVAFVPEEIQAMRAACGRGEVHAVALHLAPLPNLPSQVQ